MGSVTTSRAAAGGRRRIGAGVREGGRFATEARTEADVQLTAAVDERPVSAWTMQSVFDYVAATPAMNWRSERQEDYERRFVRQVSEFGLSIRLDQVDWPASRWDADCMPIADVEVARIQSSTQSEGVGLDIVEHYLRHPNDLIDREGWFNNKIPVLLLRGDGTYTVRDGNHRCIAALLRGDARVTAHVVH